MTTFDYILAASCVAGLLGAVLFSRTARLIVRESLLHPLRRGRLVFWSDGSVTAEDDTGPFDAYEPKRPEPEAASGPGRPKETT